MNWRLVSIAMRLNVLTSGEYCCEAQCTDCWWALQ